MADEYYAGDDGGNWDYIPQDTNYYVDSYDPAQFDNFDLASLLASQDVIPFDAYGAPDLSALYNGVPDVDALVTDGAYSPEVQNLIQQAQGYDPVSMATAINPNITSDIQDLGNGSYMVNGQLMDDIQLMDYVNRPSFMDSLKGDQFGISRSVYSEDPRGTGLFGVSTVNPAQSYKLSDGTVVGMLEDGADVQNPYDYKQVGENTFIMNNNTGRAIGYLDNNNQEQYYQQDRMENNAGNGFSGSLMKLGNLLGQGASSAANRTATKMLTKGQTAMNTAGALAQLAAVLAGNKGITAPTGNRDAGAGEWTVGRAAGSGRKKG